MTANKISKIDQIEKELTELFNFTGKKRKKFTELLAQLIDLKIEARDPHPMQIFVFGSNKTLGNKIATLLGIKPASYVIKLFDDNERIPHQRETVREKDVYVIFTSQKGKTMDKWKNDYLAFIKSIKWGEPHRVTVVLPLWYQQRADVENHELREPKMATHFAELLKAAGVDRIITCKLHNPASSTTDPPMTNIGTSKMLVKYIKEGISDLSRIAIGTGDMSGAKYARKIAGLLGVPIIITDKNRDQKSGETKPMNIFFDKKPSKKITTVVFIDDIMSTGGTLAKSASSISSKYPHIVDYIAVVTHPDFVPKTAATIINSKIKSIWATDTVPISPFFIKKMEKAGKEVKVMPISKLIARVIDNLHHNVPISELWVNGH
ncbi:MAG: ribose-phosphate diphosphokinase [Patescibacteria group bacterium]